MSTGADHPATHRRVFITGATGYLGSRLVPLLIERGHQVRALVREGRANRLPAACEQVVGNALDANTYAHHVSKGVTFVHLIGTPKPSPSKAAEFERVDFVSVREAVRAAAHAGAGHFVYLSVAQPAAIMQAYVDVRARGEALVRESNLPATFLRPWYVLGPGHRWPYALLPMYWVMKALPSTREKARRLDLVTLPRMLGALVQAVEQPPDESPRVVDVPQLRRAPALRPATRR
ncbi:MAG: NAD(P)H-binding protein [Gemmatimonadaceae bacterium]